MYHLNHAEKTLKTHPHTQCEPTYDLFTLRVSLLAQLIVFFAFVSDNKLLTDVVHLSLQASEIKSKRKLFINT